MTAPMARANQTHLAAEPFLRRALLGLALAGLAAGLGAWLAGLVVIDPGLVWTVAALPVAVTLAVLIVRDFRPGRLAGDIAALVSMTLALILGEALAAIVVAVVYAGGAVLEDVARARAGRDLLALAGRSPRIAHRQADGRLETVAVDMVAIGDRLLVRPGELIPVDGYLTDPHALIDRSAVTGQLLPERHREGDLLLSGTANAGAPFSMCATAKAGESTHAGIVRMVAAARSAQALLARRADRLAMGMLPLALLVAGLACYFAGEASRALAVLVVVAPHALVLAAPVALLGGVSQAARRGIITKGSTALEALAGVRTAIFDRTGTLTLGGSDLIAADVAPGRDAGELLRLLASLMQASHHVLGESIVRLARERALALSAPTGVRQIRGPDLEAEVDGTAVRAGSRTFVLGEGMLPGWAAASEERYGGEPVLRVFVAVGGRLAGIFTFGDSLRGDARETIDRLRAQGISRLVMLDGDDGGRAERVKAALGIDEVIAGAGPDEKIAAVEAEMRRSPVIMVGNGVNDASVLAVATVGVAIGARGAAASQAADAVVLTNRLYPVADLIGLARRARAIAIQGIVAGLVLSGAGMIGASLGFISPVGGALLQGAVQVVIVLNALRALHGRDGGVSP